MMTDPELNERIARRMGWELTGIQWVLNDRGLAHSEPTDYLDPKRLVELLKLAATMGRWELWVDGQGIFHAKIELPAEGDDDDPHATGKGFTEPLAVARAIVAHAKAKGAADGP